MTIHRILLSVFYAICCFMPSAYLQLDYAHAEGGQGSSVVETVLDILQDACIYSDADSFFLRRLAYVETRDGLDPNTYNTSYDGGIWKVDQAMFQRTLTEANKLQQQYHAAKDKFNIDWTTVKWSDLRKPLYSALAAIFYLMLEGAPANVPPSIDGQASYWLAHYRQGRSDLGPQNFSVPAKSLDDGCTRSGNLDLLFLVDTSSSVGPAQWAYLVKFIDFTAIHLYTTYGINDTKDRIALVTFSDKAQLAFGFDKGHDLMMVLSQVNRTSHPPGESNFTAAFQLAQSQVFIHSRPDAAKVAILLTDGRSSSDQISTLENSVRLKSMEVTIFAVGIGKDVSADELQQISTTPTCSHTYYVSDFSQLTNLHLPLEKTTCKVAVMLNTGQYTYPCGFSILAEVQDRNIGTSVTVSVQFGSVDVYASFSSHHPNQDVHDFTQRATASAPAILYLRKSQLVILSVESEGTNGLLCNGNFTVRIDDQTAKRTDCNNHPPDFVILLDATLAKTDDDWVALLDFVQTFIQQFEVDALAAHLAFLSFADTLTIHFNLGQLSSSSILQAIRGLQRPQATTSNLTLALNYVANQIFKVGSGARATASKALILITPGEIVDPYNALTESAMLHTQGVRIVVAAVGNPVSQVFLNTIASGSQHLNKIPDVNSLRSVIGQIIEEACSAVSLICIEDGISRSCRIEDIVNSQYGSLLGPDRNVGFNPCSLVLGSGLNLDRFPHPTDSDKFLLCDTTGQAYVVLCPLREVYNTTLHECRRSIVSSTTPPPPTVPSSTVTVSPTQQPSVCCTPPNFTPTDGNPCTASNILNGQIFHAYPADKKRYYHCLALPMTGTLESCSIGKFWCQILIQCIFEGVVVDQNTMQINPNIPNPCVEGQGFFPSPTDASSYIECNKNHEGYLRKCPLNQYWDQGLQRCHA